MSDFKAFVAAVRDHTGVGFSDDELKRIEAGFKKSTAASAKHAPAAKKAPEKQAAKSASKEKK